MRQDGVQMKQKKELDKDLENLVKASILGTLWRSQVRVCHGQEITTDDLKLNDTALAFYQLNHGNTLSEIVERMKKQISENLDAIVRNSKSERNVVEETYNAVDLILHNFRNIRRDGTKLLVTGRFARYEIDLFDRSIVARCKGGHRKLEKICLQPKRDVGHWIGLDQVPLEEPRVAVCVAINLVSDKNIVGELHVPRYLTECPHCVIEGHISKDDILLLENALVKNEDVSSLFHYQEYERWARGNHRILAERTASFHIEQLLDKFSHRVYEEWQRVSEEGS